MNGAGRLFSLLLLLAPCVAAAEGVDPKVVGSYAYAGGSEEKANLSAAIEKVVSQMSAITRGIARSRLEKGNAPTAEVVISTQGHNITIARSGKPPVTAPIDGSKVQQNTTAGVQDVSCTLIGGGLVQDMRGPNSHSTNTFSLAPDGVTLTIRTKIESGRLPGPVLYSMTYKKR